MNVTHPRPERTLTLSLSIYRALLRLAPHAG
jgi:hypothetical protein